MKSLLSITLFFLATPLLYATPSNMTKQSLHTNMTLTYNHLPPKVENINEILSEGVFYGRLRSNSFIFDAGSEGENHHITALGGSIVYKTAQYKGFAFTSGLYTSQTFGQVDSNALNSYRSAKDTFSRYAVASKGKKSMTLFAQNYLSYQKSHMEFKLGRFLLESSLLKSNDTKMIPNSFQGVSFTTDAIENNKVTLAYLNKQKLRDHESFHSLFAYNDDSNSLYAQWRENDDGAMHRGITTSKLHNRGIDDNIFLIDIENSHFKNTNLHLGYTAIPQLLSALILEGEHQFRLNNGLTIKPALRYMQQFDEGAGEIGGANLKTDTRGYKNPNDLSTSLLATRLDFDYNPIRLRFGYSQVSDRGDIVTPWRGQATAGYTRPMSGMNWYANTKSYMLRADYDFPQKSLLQGIHLMSRYTINNFDDNKPAVTADTNVLTLDLIKHFKDTPNLSFKLRSIMVKEDHKVHNIDGTYKKDPSYKELRLEMNYLF